MIMSPRIASSRYVEVVQSENSVRKLTDISDGARATEAGDTADMDVTNSNLTHNALHVPSSLHSWSTQNVQELGSYAGPSGFNHLRLRGRRGDSSMVKDNNNNIQGYRKKRHGHLSGRYTDFSTAAPVSVTMAERSDTNGIQYHTQSSQMAMPQVSHVGAELSLKLDQFPCCCDICHITANYADEKSATI
ncbi:unnamed protein product [Protopolystoma xenopodis]|uniref:Uncharacterized protein n=1 Tax=Protopolystoma xenopodis TaxID=117903 RepID=A0A3S5AM53_9PLAT|nr:unnamed protein product [Protopolystoma xenopodis]